MSRNGNTATATKPGLTGLLTMRTRPIDNEGVVEHHGLAQLVGMGHGMFLFRDLVTGIEMWLYADEVVRFTTDGAS